MHTQVRDCGRYFHAHISDDDLQTYMEILDYVCMQLQMHSPESDWFLFSDVKFEYSIVVCIRVVPVDEHVAF